MKDGDSPGDIVFRTRYGRKGPIWQSEPLWEQGSLSVLDPSSGRATRITSAPSQVDTVAESQKGRGSQGADPWLSVTCWCERTIVDVPASEICAGQTASCGRPRCQPKVSA